MSRTKLVLFTVFVLATFILAPLTSYAQSSAQSKNLLYFGKEQAVTITLQSEPSGTYIFTAQAKNCSLLTISEVLSPARLVLDFSGQKLGSSTILTPTKNPLIKSVRAGAHPDKLRLVLDFIDPAIPSYQTEKEQCKVTLSFKVGSSKTSSITETVSSSPTPTSSPVQSPTPEPTASEVSSSSSASPPASATETPSPKVSLIPTPLATATPTATPTPSPTPTATPELPSSPPPASPSPIASPVVTQEVHSGSPALKAILFTVDEGAKSQAVQLVVEGKSEFKLARRSDREYVLTIEGGKVPGTYLALPQYPPQDFDGLTYVLAGQKDGNVEVSIGTERGTKLTAYFKDTNIWIRTAP